MCCHYLQYHQDRRYVAYFYKTDYALTVAHDQALFIDDLRAFVLRPIFLVSGSMFACVFFFQLLL